MGNLFVAHFFRTNSDKAMKYIKYPTSRKKVFFVKDFQEQVLRFS